jgi:hypothetical protein
MIIWQPIPLCPDEGCRIVVSHLLNGITIVTGQLKVDAMAQVSRYVEINLKAVIHIDYLSNFLNRVSLSWCSLRCRNLQVMALLEKQSDYSHSIDKESRAGKWQDGYVSEVGQSACQDHVEPRC